MIDVAKLYGFIKNEMGISYQSVPRYEGGVCKTYKTELERMIKFKELYNKKLNRFQVAHKLAKHKWGRIVPHNYLSLSIFHRPTRHTFCDDVYTDNKYVANPKIYRTFIMKHHDCSKDTALTFQTFCFKLVLQSFR